MWISHELLKHYSPNEPCLLYKSCRPKMGDHVAWADDTKPTKFVFNEHEEIGTTPDANILPIMNSSLGRLSLINIPALMEMADPSSKTVERVFGIGPMQSSSSNALVFFFLSRQPQTRAKVQPQWDILHVKCDQCGSSHEDIGHCGWCRVVLPCTRLGVGD